LLKKIPSTWIIEEEHRLDCGPFVKGSVEARKTIEALPCSKNRLVEVTKDGIDGMYHVGQDKIVWVEDEELGLPFVRSSDILKVDLSNQPLISRRQVAANSLFQCPEGTTLITRSGTIGRMAYMRSDMVNTAISQDVLKVVPDESKIRPGYLYAFLNSNYGLPIVTGGTFGSIIVHIEAENISELPIPRLGDVEGEAHKLVHQAAELRVQASELISEQIRDLEEEIAGGPISWEHRKPQAFSVGTQSINHLFNRLDAFHYIGFVGEAIEKVCVPLVEISHYADALYPPFMKRIRVEEGGVEFLGGTEMLTLDQRSDSHIAASTKDLDQFIVKDGNVLFQCDGQRYGIFGRPVLANRNIIGKAVTQHMMRIIPHDKSDAGYIFTYLATGFGRRLLMRFSAGTSIPSLNEDGARKILIYWPDEERRRSISQAAEQAWENRAVATELEDQARALVERTIEEGGR
jgi:type I restriction enzyme S subunit